ncbi:hypothetical protein F4802DRAFT_562267 [Xylaria palmicola]|nr:hypothetical protein F4802DRAFT_562267 [Xylaria palmicola]
MLRSSRLCRRALARPLASSPREHGSSSLLRKRAAPARPAAGHLWSPATRCFTTSRRLADPSNPWPRGQESPTIPPPPPAEAAEPNPDHTSQSRSKSRRQTRTLIYLLMFSALGSIAAEFVYYTFVEPPALPPPGSKADARLQSTIEARGAALPIVRQLSADPSWTSWDAYAGISSTTSPDDDPQALSAARSRITSGPLAGSAGLAFQRIFHNASTGEVVTVVYFGPRLVGWPGIVHGGALATVLDESLGRCAILRFPGRTGVTANLELVYRALTMTQEFCVVRTWPVAGEDDDVVGNDGVRKGDRKLWVRGTLENASGNVTVEAKGLFVVPKSYKLRPLVEGF